MEGGAAWCLRLDAQIEVYDAMREELEREHHGKWVVIHDEELVGTYRSFQAAAIDAVEKFGRGPYLIREIGEPPIVLYRRVYVPS